MLGFNPEADDYDLVAFALIGSATSIFELVKRDRQGPALTEAMQNLLDQQIEAWLQAHETLLRRLKP